MKTTTYPKPEPKLKPDYSPKPARRRAVPLTADDTDPSLSPDPVTPDPSHKP